MDLFTHVIFGYLISYGIVGFQPQYLAAGALAGGLPDADILFFPIARRFPILRHHGITHSIFGVTLVALAGAYVGPMIAAGSPWVYFLVMWAAGMGHVLCDAFTQFSVAPLLPFSDRPLEIDADRAINFVTLAASIVALFLLGFERFRVPFAIYTLTIDGMLAFYVGYLVVRLLGRYAIGRVRRRFPEFSIIAPTGNPLLWMLLFERRQDGRLQTGYLRYRLGQGVIDGPYRIDVPTEPVADTPPAPARTSREALERSYPIARRTSGVLDQTYHFADAQPDAGGGWRVRWYSLEFTAFGRAAGVEVRIAPDGQLAARSSWGRIPATPQL
jgi:membrane-bound metal-dependent hydrolase YbcI (DUF457 family)